MITNSKTGILSIVNAAILFSFPTPCQAASAELPWDFTLTALATLLVDRVAPWAVGCAFVSSLVLYAIGGHDESAGRMFGSGIGGLIALALVHLLNYVAF